METPRPAYQYQSEAERPFTSPRDFYRLRDFGQKFEAAIAFLRKHGANLYRVLAVPILIGAAPLLLLVLSIGRLGTFTTTTQAGDFGGILGEVLPFILGAGLLLLAGFAVVFAMLHGFVKARMYHPDPSAKLTTGEVWATSRPYLLPLIGYLIVAGIITGIASFFLMLPGIYVGIVFLLLPSVVLFEDADLGQAISRCFSLTSGKWWSTFGLYVVGSIAMYMVVFALSLLLSMLLMPLVGVAGAAGPIVLVLTQAVQMAVQFLLFPVVYVLLMFQYFNLVERRDHVSLQWRAEELGQGAAPRGPAAGNDDTLFRPSYGDQTL